MKIKVITLNLWHGGDLMDKILDFLIKEDPDIIFCQEANNGRLAGVPRGLNTLTIFAEKLRDYNQIFFPLLFWSKEPKIEQGLLTLSRFRIAEKGLTFFGPEYSYYPMPIEKNDWSGDPSAISQSVAVTEAGEIDLFNVHGVWGYDGADSEIRLKMSSIIVDKIGSSKKAILAGDFNMFPNTESIGNIEKNLHSVFGTELKTTHNLSRKPSSYGQGPVDMMFVTKNIKVLAHYCPEVDISDHLPLVATLEI